MPGGCAGKRGARNILQGLYKPLVTNFTIGCLYYKNMNCLHKKDTASKTDQRRQNKMDNDFFYRGSPLQWYQKPSILS